MEKKNSSFPMQKKHNIKVQGGTSGQVVGFDRTATSPPVWTLPTCISQGSERPTRAVCLEAPKRTPPKTSPGCGQVGIIQVWRVRITTVILPFNVKSPAKIRCLHNLS